MLLISFIPAIDFTQYGLRKITARQFILTLPAQLKVDSKPLKKKKEQVQPVPLQIEGGEEEEEDEEDTKSQVSEVSNSSAKTRQRKGTKQQKGNVVDDKNSVTSQPESTDDVKYFCSKCAYKNDNVNKFLRHWSDVHQKTVFACRIDPCTKWYQMSAGLRQHVHGHHASVLTCEHCGLICLNPFLLQDHEKKHDNSSFVCIGCNKSFTRNDDKNRHYKYRCTANPNRFTKCKHCLRDKVFPDVLGAEVGLMSHLAEKHGMKGTYLCINCHGLFTTPKNIDTHQKKCKKNHPDL